MENPINRDGAVETSLKDRGPERPTFGTGCSTARTVARSAIAALLLAVVPALFASCATPLDNPEDFVNPNGSGGTAGLGGGSGTGGGISGTGGMSGTGGSGGSAGMGTVGCDAPAMVFAIPGEEGGCDGAACHKAGFFPPDLISPGVADRILGDDQMGAPAEACAGQKYVDPVNIENSYLLKKMLGTAECGEPMPYDLAASSMEQIDCVRSWLTEIAGP